MPSQDYQSPLPGNPTVADKQPDSRDRHCLGEHPPQEKSSPVQKGMIQDLTNSQTLRNGENRNDEEGDRVGTRPKQTNGEHRGSPSHEEDNHEIHHKQNSNSHKHSSGSEGGKPIGLLPGAVVPSQSSLLRDKDRAHAHLHRERSGSNPSQPHFCRHQSQSVSNGDLHHHQHHHRSSTFSSSSRHSGDMRDLVLGRHAPSGTSLADDRLRFTPPPSPSMRHKSSYFTPPPSPSVRHKSMYFTPPPSPGLKSKSLHSSPSLQSKNHHGLATHSYRNGKRTHSSRSESSEEEKCLPQMESIIRQMASGQ